MKLVVIFFLFMAATAHAAPVIENLVASPAVAWVGDPVSLSLRCTDNESLISEVRADVTGPGFLLPNLQLAPAGDGLYIINIPGFYFDRAGNFNAIVHCTSVSDNTTNSTTSFSFSLLEGQISYVTNPAYAGDLMEIRVVPKRDGIIVTSGISFALLIDGQAVALSMPPIFDTTKGWVLRVQAPQSGMHTIVVDFTHNGKTIRMSTQTEVRQPVEFDIVSMERQSVISGENITLSIKASDRGAPVQINSTLLITVNSERAEIKSIAQNGNVFSVRVGLPRLPAGRYQITAGITYNNTQYSSSRSVDYTSIVSGELEDRSGKPVQGSIRFLKSGSEVLMLNTLSDGTYSGRLVPDTYDIEMNFQRADIMIDDAVVSSFPSNPITYYYDPTIVEGFTGTGVYVVKLPWRFSSATLTLDYDEGIDESSISIFKCADWDGACKSSWTKISPVVNKDQNKVSFTIASLSAFFIGSEDSIKATLKFDKPVYGLKDVIRVSGSVRGQSQLANVSVRLKIPGTQIDQTVYSNQNGIFSMEFLGPDEPGVYSAQLTAKKYPYAAFNWTYSFEVASLPSVSIIFPGSVRVEQGSNITENIAIINTGQTALTDIKISLDLDKKYYSIGNYATTLDKNGEASVPISLFSANETPTTMSATIRFESNEITKEKIFGFTITEKIDKKSTENAATGFAVALPSFDADTLYILIFASAAFLFSFVAKRYRKTTKPKTKNQHTVYIEEVKSHIESKKRKIGVRGAGQ